MKRALVFWKYRTLFSLFLCTMVLFKVHLTHAAPTSQQHTEPLSRSTINTRGSHWAVGHLMGKKSIEEYPYVYEGVERAPASAYTEGERPVQLYPQALLNLLQMLEISDSRNSQALREAALYKKLWDTEDTSKVKEMLDFFYQLMTLKENSSS
ncbi:hypothetical protein XENTR_v10003058 [Xenopus tropicalis]|uniref:Gastrin-releasing peptide n=1 Tax=Xenopus tropicalis TaxID=8364 RepID=F7CE29_XENTR|nr:gastrin-releasing peptide [Xenopus tropicalis]KAE8636606.1 hypothetical protein XENTR_v10003058 [Xenopus tropicalis]|eukprot:XP_017946323.1 PREDICTED: gastrin-releasing peptide [Xenopus tropicalis]